MGRVRTSLSALRLRLNARVGRKVNPPPEEEQWSTIPEWLTVSSGPLKGRQLFVSPNPTWQSMVEGTYESFVFDTLSKHQDLDSAIIWDIGAHVGYYALAFASLVGQSGHVVTFEPNPHNANRIRQHLARNPDLASRVTLVTEALSDSSGEEVFVLSPELELGHSSGSHFDSALAPEKQEAYEAFDRTVVQTVRADTLLSEGRIPAPSIVKMDVEGAELSVLKGSSTMLSEVKPILLIEVHHIVMMFHVHKLLADAGYKIEIVDEEHSPASRCHIIAKPLER